jgi:hypothetical protein
MSDQRRGPAELAPAECMSLLSAVPFGRIVFTARALPAVRLASHLVDGGRVIVRAGNDAAIISPGMAGTVVAYQADAIDPARNLGWSVTVVGMAHPVTAPDTAAAFRQALSGLADGGDGQVITIDVGLVTGFRLAAGAPTGVGGSRGGLRAAGRRRHRRDPPGCRRRYRGARPQPCDRPLGRGLCRGRPGARPARRAGRSLPP